MLRTTKQMDELRFNTPAFKSFKFDFWGKKSIWRRAKQWCIKIPGSQLWAGRAWRWGKGNHYERADYYFFIIVILRSRLCLALFEHVSASWELKWELCCDDHIQSKQQESQSDLASSDEKRWVIFFPLLDQFC